MVWVAELECGKQTENRIEEHRCRQNIQSNNNTQVFHINLLSICVDALVLRGNAYANCLCEVEYGLLVCCVIGTLPSTYNYKLSFSNVH